MVGAEDGGGGGVVGGAVVALMDCKKVFYVMPAPRQEPQPGPARGAGRGRVSREVGGCTHIYAVYSQYIVQERERALSTLQEGAAARAQARERETESACKREGEPARPVPVPELE